MELWRPTLPPDTRRSQSQALPGPQLPPESTVRAHHRFWVAKSYQEMNTASLTGSTATDTWLKAPMSSPTVSMDQVLEAALLWPASSPASTAQAIAAPEIINALMHTTRPLLGIRASSHESRRARSAILDFPCTR